MKNIQYLAIAAFTCLASLTSCSSDSAETNSPQTDYDRDAMLSNYSTNLIVPGYQRLQAEADAMATAISAFTANPSAATLATARQAYLKAYSAWQQVSTYNFGPADDLLLRNNLNIYPTSTSEIEANIAAGTYDLQAAANLDAKGFPAVDYLLYRGASEAETLALYTSDAKAQNRKQYLAAVASLIQQSSQAAYSGWANGYADTFRQAAGTAVGSAVGNLVNQLNADIDLTKRAKVGIPSGRFTAGSAFPEKVEGYYSHSSLDLLKQAIKAEKAIFVGQGADGVNGPGLDDYLDHVNAKYNGGPLSDAIEAQFDAALAAANALPAPLSEAISTQPQAVTKVYDELQKLIVLTKTDLPAALGVTITYTDNDGD